jgi:hypothetical protein
MGSIPLPAHVIVAAQAMAMVLGGALFVVPPVNIGRSLI